MIEADIAIIGAGMAGASLAAAIGDAARVVLIEAESQPGYHATGRSAAFWSETYGGPAIQPLTSASGAFLQAGGFLVPRGALTVAAAGDEGLLDRMAAEFADSGVCLNRIDDADKCVPGLLRSAGLSEPSCCDIDVAALHAHYLSAVRANLVCDATAFAIERSGAAWQIATRAGLVRAEILVDAAGAWASEIATMAGAWPIPITPYRRTMVQLLIDPPVPVTLPLVIDAAERFYFKPESGGRLWLSPHDETLSTPTDAAADELDVAIAIDRLEQVVRWRIVKRERAWAGLRCFAPDRAPVYGFDTQAPGFFWFAGQGGFGIQTAPIAAAIGAALLLDRPPPDIDIARYAPERFG